MSTVAVRPHTTPALSLANPMRQQAGEEWATHRVAVISPEPVVLAGVSAMLEGHDEVELLDGGGGSCQQGEVSADVVLYDVIMLREGEEHLRGLLDRHQRVVALDRVLRPDLGARALALGAVALLPGEVGESDLLAALRRAASTRFPSRAQEDATQHRLGQDIGLTEREHQVLTLIAYGLSNQEITRRLYLSINTVKTYIRTAYQRIGVTSRSQAVVWCVSHGYSIVDPEPEADEQVGTGGGAAPS